MNELKKAILDQGVLVSDEILKVDSFLNHQINSNLMHSIGQDFSNYFKDKNVTKVVTIEAGGIAPALATAFYLNVPMVFIKKSQPSTMKDPLVSHVFSFTKNTTYPLCIEREYLNEGDNLLFIDDFLARGEAFKAIEDLTAQAGANLVGVGMCIDKTWQAGHDYILSKGYDLCSLAPIASMSKKNGINWLDE
jgi:xanthine phosphoribosyltransferase